MPSETVEIDGLRLHVSVTGEASGLPLLLLHGGMAHAGWWGPLVRALGPDVRCVAPDRRGHGRSDWADLEQYGWEIDLKDTEQVAGRLAGQSWIVVGHSQGGLLATHLALRGTIDMAGLVLLDVPLEPRAPSLVRAGKSFRRVPQIRYPSLASAVRRFQPYPTPHHVPESTLAEIAERSFKPCEDGDGFVSCFHWRRFQANDGPTHPLLSFSEDVRRVRCPTLVVRAEESSILSRADHAAFVERLPRGQGVEIPGVTHSLHVEDPDSVAREIRRFVAESVG